MNVGMQESHGTGDRCGRRVVGTQVLGCREAWGWGSLDVPSARCNNCIVNEQERYKLIKPHITYAKPLEWY